MKKLLPLAVLASSAWAQVTATAVGHEFQQDDWPSIAAAADGSLWVAWLSFNGERDDIGLRRQTGGRWSNLQWVPGTSGDSFLPQVATDATGRVWVVWSQQAGGNWDLYARRFDPTRQEWSALERLTSDPLPDINPRLAPDGKGGFAVAWQGFRGKNSNIFLKWFDGEKFSADVRVTSRAANDWEPAVAVDSWGDAWVAYDSYKNGTYDVFLSKVEGARVSGAEMAVADTARFETRATVAVDTAGRVWVAWEAGRANWGKDQGYILRANPAGVPLGAVREPRIRCYEGGEWREPQAALASVFSDGNTYQPHVYSDGRGSVWVVAKTRRQIAPTGPGPGQRGYWEYRITRLEGAGWSQPVALPSSKGRSSTRLSGTAGSGGGLHLVWPTDNRAEAFYHRPLRQQIFTGTIAAPSAAASPALKATPAETVDAKPGHTDETADLRAIRAYTAPVGGRPHRIVRGDFHRHTELSWDGGGAQDGSLQDFYRYMIDAASMDFGASTDHQGGAWLYWWWYTQKMTDM
ncbi:MAG: TolB family protein, partial [Bryobacteraceae bacterium]